jgi:ABC-type amino acid transport substrate-binding protein
VAVAVLTAAGIAVAGRPARAADDAEARAAPAPVRKLRVAVLPMATAVDWDGSRPTGVVIDVWDEITGRLDATSDFIRVGSIRQLIDAVCEGGNADVALGPMAITEARERIFDLTHPIIHSGQRIAVRQRANMGFTGVLASLLSWRLLQLAALVLTLALAAGHLLWWCERRVNPRSFPPEYPRGVFEAVWWIASTIITGGCDDKHVDSPLGRILGLTWMIGGIVLVAGFTSVLTAELTAERVTGTIHGPRDLAGRTVGCQEDFVGCDSVRQRGGSVQEFPNISEALDALAMGMVDAVVAENQQLLRMLHRRPQADIRVVGPIFDTFDFGFGLPTGSPLREPLNAVILQMREDGVLDRIMRQWLGTHD